MREAASASPFAAPTREARQARWLLWQKQSVEPEGTYHAPERGGDSVQPRQPEGNHQPIPDVRPVPSYEPPLTAVAALQHRRYDAVVQRMQQAGQRAGSYQPVS